MNKENLEGGEASTPNKDSTPPPKSVINRGISVLDSILRFVAIFGTLGSTLAMGTTNETLPFATQFFRFKAEYNDLPTLTFFVIANSIVCGYLVLSLPLSIYHILRTKAKTTRIVLLIFDTAMLGLVTGGASSATAIVYLAHEGNASANWPAICQQFDTFCERISGSLIGSFAASILLMLIIITSAIALSRH